jgi:glycogen debranching enzyme
MVKKIQLDEQWFILATSAPPDDRRRVLKHNDTFALFDRFGDIQPIGLGEEGIYNDDTRYLSHQEMLIDGHRPMYLNSSVKEDSGVFIVELMNPDIERQEKPLIEKGLMHIFRAKLLWDGACYEHIRIVNFGLEPIEVTLSMELGADYADIFEVRGYKREHKGDHLDPTAGEDELVFAYKGLDQTLRRTRIGFNPPPDNLSTSHAEFLVSLPPKGETHLFVTVCCEFDGKMPSGACDYYTALGMSSKKIGQLLHEGCQVSTSNQLVNRWIDRSASDLVMLTSRLPDGLYPYAGVPWYSTTFGRDGILTAWECLWIYPHLAGGVLRFLAASQATEENPKSDAEPGKILHEARKSELALLDEVPFRRYYGTVDATPLFVGLAGAYYERTGDLELIQSIWPNIQLALEWIDRYGDSDGDGFVEFRRRSKTGLIQQGWKDSHDSVFHADGQLADAPIALCEVQGYVYQAKRYAAELAEVLGDEAQAQRLRDAAELLRQRFNDAFWCEAIGSYALALDGRKHPCAVRASNAGHALWSGIASQEHAERISRQLLDEEFFCGWGIRTLSSRETRYNPMAYHNGSVWPHDNALIAAGMARYGLKEAAMAVFAGMFDVSLHVDQHRLPELFCGFDQRMGEGPTMYPVACSPQAWAAASVFYLLQSSLGLTFNADRSEIRFQDPKLPKFIDAMEIKGLWSKEGRVDLRLQRYPNSVGIDVISKQGGSKVIVEA